MSEQLYVVRLYDGFDMEWMDISGVVSKEDADRIWNEKTNNGTRNTTYDDIDYFKIFKADTIMLYSEEHKEQRKRNSSKVCIDAIKELEVYVGRAAICGCVVAGVVADMADDASLADMVKSGLTITKELGPIKLENCIHNIESSDELITFKRKKNGPYDSEIDLQVRAHIYFNQNKWIATSNTEGFFAGEGDSQEEAILALLADKLGVRPI